MTLSAPLTEPPFQIVALTDQDRSTFSCGAAPLDDYLRRQANQDVKRHVAACFVAIHASTGRLAGYYTLSACHLYLNDLPPEWQRKLPKYPTVPAVRLGRLAIDLGFQGRNLGAALLANAAKRALRSEVAAALMVVDAKDHHAAKFYRHHGFVPDPTAPSRLYAPLETLRVGLELR